MDNDHNQLIISGVIQRVNPLREGKKVKVWSFTLKSRKLKRGYSDGDYEKYTFIDVACFGPLAEHREAELAIGDVVLIGGELQGNSWEKDGEKHYKLEVIADSIMRLPLPEELGSPRPEVPLSPLSEDNIPF